MVGTASATETLLGISKLSAHHDKFHVGVIMAAVRTIEERRKKHEPTEALALKSMLDRCYLVRQEDVTKEMKECLLMTLLSQPGNGFSKSAISPLLRAGIVNDDSKFSCRAAPWCYNRNCFPGRPLDPPDTLRDLIMLSIGSMPAKRLRDAVQSGFPKEAAFQQLMNEAMSAHMPARHAIVPELNTFAVDSQHSRAEPVLGELDFYVNGSKQWCIEMLREGEGIGEHLNHFRREGTSRGKCRKVEAKDYYVVDCRGPKKRGGAKIENHRCTLCFADDFSLCCCQMKGYQDEDISLQM